MTNDEISHIAETLDGRDRFVLDWLYRNQPMRYDQISGSTLDALMVLRLVEIRPVHGPRTKWPVSCSLIGDKVAKYLQTHKTRRA